MTVNSQNSQTIPIPLPDNPEKTGTLTSLLRALEANGLCIVHQAVIVETDNRNTYRLIEELIQPPESVQPAKNGKTPVKKRSFVNSNVYTDPATGEEYSNHRLKTKLTRGNFALGQQFSHQGEGLLEVYRDLATNKLQLRKVEA
jgi:hypothetical protein